MLSNMSNLRDFQIRLKSDVYRAWSEGANNVMMVSPTGSGKTVTFCDILNELQYPACVTSHRQELISQTALALNREKVVHGLIAPKAVIQQIIALEMETHGYSRYSSRAPIRVAGVHSLPNQDTSDRWFKQVLLVIQDEGHHVLKDNVWGRAMAMFPYARGLFPTAHAIRADGAGLGRHADGLVDRLVVGPSCRSLINRGFLTDYDMACPESDIDLSSVPIGATGDFSAPKLRAAVHRSRTIVGDVVKHYLKFAGGKLGITFVVDVEAATETAAAYRAAGVAAEVITANTPIAVRAQLMRQFRARRLLQLVSVDVLGEGTDVPAIEVVSMARATASFQLFSQQFGRALRIMVSDQLNNVWDGFTDQGRLDQIARSVKPKALILDHVGNWRRHGMPDVPQEYSLDPPERGARRSKVSNLRSCLNPECLRPYERFLLRCPYCGQVHVPQDRSTAFAVDGDLTLLAPEVLAALRGEVARVDAAPRIPQGSDGIVSASIFKNHRERQDAQRNLREVMALWGGYNRHLGYDDRVGYKRFYLEFAVSVIEAQALGAREAEALRERIQSALNLVGVVPLGNESRNPPQPPQLLEQSAG